MCQHLWQPVAKNPSQKIGVLRAVIFDGSRLKWLLVICCERVTRVNPKDPVQRASVNLWTAQLTFRSTSEDRCSPNCSKKVSGHVLFVVWRLRAHVFVAFWGVFSPLRARAHPMEPLRRGWSNTFPHFSMAQPYLAVDRPSAKLDVLSAAVAMVV